MTESERLARLERALWYGGPTHRVSDVAAMVKDGRAQWWSNDNGMIVTEVHEYPLQKAVHYWLIAGELRDCLALEHEINPWAIEQGCNVATACGRRGWGRVAAPTGWRSWHPNFIKPLTGANDDGR